MSTYSANKGALQFSTNYIWNTADNVGRGASAIVYLGRHRNNGKVVAVKLLHESSFGGDNMRELDILRRLRHENIISLFDIEREDRTGRLAIIMQYCDGGSLYHMLDLPQYAYGLPEDEYLLVLKHVGAGMEYLRQLEIVHRDIKPGNILRAITEDGRSVYKLTDFGAARQLTPEENFTSLYGTEEYLHPEIYARAVLRKRTNKAFSAKSDLWSLGVTLYHVATGKLPFQAFGGRQNKDGMFEIISKKQNGVISGIQDTPNGQIHFSRELPKTCQLSSGLKSQLTPLLAGLMETDESRVLSYEKFFHFAKSITSQVCLTIFNYAACDEFKLYIDGHHTYSALQEMIALLTEIPALDQLLLVKGRQIDDIIHVETKIANYPAQILKGTIYLYQQDYTKVEKQKLLYPAIPPVPEFVPNSDVEKDLKLSYSCLSRAHLLKRYTEETVKKQVLLVEGELDLRSHLLQKLKCSSERYHPMLQVIKESRKRFDLFYLLFEMIRSIIGSLGYKDQYMDEILRDRSMIAVHQKAEERTEDISKYREALVERIDQDEQRTADWCARCQDVHCLSKVTHHLTTISTINGRFKRDKNVKNQMSDQDFKNHQFERQRLQDESVTISSILQDHCFQNIKIMYTEAMSKVGSLLRNVNRVSKIDKNIDSVMECQELLSRKLDKLEVNAKDELIKVQRWATGSRAPPTAPIPESLDPGGGGILSKGDTGFQESYVTDQKPHWNIEASEKQGASAYVLKSSVQVSENRASDDLYPQKQEDIHFLEKQGATGIPYKDRDQETEDHQTQKQVNSQLLEKRSTNGIDQELTERVQNQQKAKVWDQGKEPSNAINMQETSEQEERHQETNETDSQKKGDVQNLDEKTKYVEKKHGAMSHTDEVHDQGMKKVGYIKEANGHITVKQAIVGQEFQKDGTRSKVQQKPETRESEKQVMSLGFAEPKTDEEKIAGVNDEMDVDASDGITTGLRSLLNESLQLKKIVEENTRIMRSLEANAFQSTGSISRQLALT